MPLCGTTSIKMNPWAACSAKRSREMSRMGSRQVRRRDASCLESDSLGSSNLGI